jgi:hypothetical protein
LFEPAFRKPFNREGFLPVSAGGFENLREVSLSDELEISEVVDGNRQRRRPRGATALEPVSSPVFLLTRF